MVRKDLSGEQAVKSDALRLIALRPRSRAELKEKLLKKGHDAILVDSVIDYFEIKGLVNDEKFAKIIADSKLYAKPVGRRQLKADLKKKGLTEQVVEKTMESFKDYDEKAAALQVAQKRAAILKSLPPQKKRARLFGFLQRRGFSSEAIYSALSAVLKTDTVVEE